LTIAHVGDSRAYVITSDQQMQAVTVDHSLVNRLVQMGEITLEEAAVHPQRNVLVRAIGQAEPVKPDITNLPFPDGAKLLLCSDGLWGVLNQEEMLGIIQSNTDPAYACHKLVEATLALGAPDNVSIILAGFRE
jgi:protein phosphatase